MVAVVIPVHPRLASGRSFGFVLLALAPTDINLQRGFETVIERSDSVHTKPHQSTQHYSYTASIQYRSLDRIHLSTLV